MANKTKGRLLYVVNEDFAFLMNRLPMARAAREAGFEVHVATRVNKSAGAIEAEGFTVHAIPLRRGRLSLTAAASTILALRRIVKKIRPQVIHHSGLQCCVSGSLATLGYDISIVNAVTGLGYVFTSASRKSRLLKSAVQLLLPRLFQRKGSRVLVQNPDDRQTLEKLGIRSECIVLIAGSGVDTEKLLPLPEPEGPVTIGFAGRLLVDKGIRTLIAAHGLLRDRGFDIDLLIAGNPDPANPESLTLDEIEQWRDRPGVIWLGHIDEIRSLWSRCHIAVLPSYGEGLPMSLMEAAACGRPTVATDVPGCREITINNQTGILVPVGAPDALADAIARLATSTELRSRLGIAARQLVVDKLSARLVGTSIVKLYDEMAT